VGVSGDGGVGTYLASAPHSPFLPLLIPTPPPLTPPPWLPLCRCETVFRCGHHTGDGSREATVGHMDHNQGWGQDALVVQMGGGGVGMTEQQ
jgi:hypothetical protein